MANNDAMACPQCLCTVLNSASRLIHDTCGHLKCRLCLLKEEEGCITCKLKESNNTEEANYGDASHEEKEQNIDLSAEISGSLKANNNNNSDIQEPEICKTPKIHLSKNSVSTTKNVKRRSFKIGSHLTPLPGTPLKYMCTICNKQCTSKMTIRYHNYCASPNKPFTCEICGKGFVTKAHFEYHNRIHTGALPYVCSVCGKGFKQRGKLNAHSRTHTGERPFVCQECGKTFPSTESLKSHQWSHTEKSHDCSICSKKFKDYSNYKKHLFRHKGEKPFMCDECGKTFAFRRSLMTHIFIHTRERNYVCNVCNRKFAMKKDLLRHEIVHSVVRPHSCSLCKIGFRRKDNLERHMKNTHPETRMVTIGPHKQKLKTDCNKLKERNTKQTNEEDVKGKCKDLENSNDIETIPPSQTINPEILKTVPVLSKVEVGFLDKGKDVNETKSYSQSNRDFAINKTIESCVNINCPSPNATSHIHESQHIQSQTQSYENTPVLKNTNENNNSNKQEISSHTTQTIYPPKKIVEYFRAVPVINRSSNITTSNDSRIIKENDTDTVRRGEGTNCVPTITRASEYMSSSVITRNHLQSNSTVVKSTYPPDHFERAEKTCIREPQTDQPSLRRLLHDVKCCDDDNILNLTNDVSINHGSTLQEDFMQSSDSKYDRTRGSEFYGPKDLDPYKSQPLGECGIHEYSSSNVPRYINFDSSRKITADELFPDDQYRLSTNSSFQYLTQSHYVEYQDNNSEEYYSQVPSPGVTERYYEESSKSTALNYNSYNIKQFSFCDRVPSVNNHETRSCVQSIGQPVIVGTKKMTNNVIAPNFDT